MTREAEELETTENPFAEPPDRVRPSNYLRTRCPLCFGGKMSPSVLSDQPHSLVLVDACFQQKHNKRPMDPPRDLYCSLFLDETLVNHMEKYLNSVRPHPGKVRKAGNTNDEEDDGYEHDGLHVPRSVLNSCNDSFLAADESREKASTQFFYVTGLMSLICHHNHCQQQAKNSTMSIHLSKHYSNMFPAGGELVSFMI